MQEFSIVQTTDDFVVINKNTGISTHASPGDTALNLIDLLSPSLGRIFPIMRLDNGTSGLIAFGRNSDFLAGCEFDAKEYLAIVLGQTDAAGQIDLPLTKKKFGSGQKLKQEAFSEFKLIEQSKDFSLIKVTIATGRHHQIRKHLRSIGHPILGDFRHGYKDKNLLVQEKIGGRLRLALHCSRLKFKYKTKEYNFELALPEDFSLLWKKIIS